MGFQSILQSMLAEVPGAKAAMFLDYEGESVEIAGQGISPHELKVVGAYQGIFLTLLRRIAENHRLGDPLRFKTDLERLRLLNTVIDEDYYLVLVVERRTNEAIAWRQLDLCRTRILAEM